MDVVRSHSLSVGIVGLPNSGKSTLFNVLTKNSVPAENYPFCTIDKNIGVVQVQDDNVDKLAELFKSDKKVYSAIKFVDIAGLVKDAHKGEGLGNKFLGHIREVDTIMYVLRAFIDDNVEHLYEKIDPVNDLEIVQSELILKDLETVTNKLAEAENKSKAKLTDELGIAISACKKVLEVLDTGKPAIDTKLTDEEKIYTKKLFLLTSKPAIYILNISHSQEQAQNEVFISSLVKVVNPSENQFVLPVDCKLLNELDEFNEKEKAEFTSDILNYKDVKDIIDIAYRRLGLITFYSGNQAETNAWTIQKGATAKNAASVIHSDLADKFVAAEVINVKDILSLGGWAKAKEKGKVRSESRDYLVKEGDCINFLTSN